MKSKTTAHIVDDTRTLTCKRKPFYTRLHFFFSQRNSWIDLTDAYVLNVWKSSDKWAIYISRNKMKTSNECIYRASPCTNLPTLKVSKKLFFSIRIKRKEEKEGGIDGNIYRWAFANTEPYWQCAPAYGETFGEQQPGNLAEVNSFRDRRVDKHLSTVG